MLINYMRPHCPGTFDDLNCGAVFQLTANSDVFMKISGIPDFTRRYVSLSSGITAALNGNMGILPCPDAVLSRKQ